MHVLAHAFLTDPCTKLIKAPEALQGLQRAEWQLVLQGAHCQPQPMKVMPDDFESYDMLKEVRPQTDMF